MITQKNIQKLIEANALQNPQTLSNIMLNNKLYKAFKKEFNSLLQNSEKINPELFNIIVRFCNFFYWISKEVVINFFSEYGNFYIEKINSLNDNKFNIEIINYETKKKEILIFLVINQKILRNHSLNFQKLSNQIIKLKINCIFISDDCENTIKKYLISLGFTENFSIYNFKYYIFLALKQFLTDDIYIF